LVSSYYRDGVAISRQRPAAALSDEQEKLPGSGTSRGVPFDSPYRERGR
jgi:hypothetical protein